MDHLHLQEQLRFGSMLFCNLLGEAAAEL